MAEKTVEQDNAAFEEIMSEKAWKPLSGEPLELMMASMAQMNPRLALRFAFDAGMRHQDKRGLRVVFEKEPRLFHARPDKRDG